MHPHSGAVEHEVFIVAGLAEDTEDYFPPPVEGPGTEAVIDALPRAEVGGQIPPWGSGAQDPQDRLYMAAHVLTRAATPFDPAQGIPMGLNFF